MPKKSAHAAKNAASEENFDPSTLTLEVEHQDSSSLAVERDPQSFIRGFTARVVRRTDLDEEISFPPPESLQVAKIDFEHIATSAWGADESLKTDLADSISGDLLALFDAIYDDDGEVRADLNPTTYGDILHIEMIEVAAGENVFEVVRYALENILSRYGSGLMGAAYYQANWESIGVARPLKDRGFFQTQTNRHVWFVDLGMRRQPLP